jgi:hypothetical protein
MANEENGTPETQLVLDSVFEPQEHSDKMRSTSIDAFQRIKTEGLLSKMRWLVYECLFQYGPLTGAELDERLRGKKGGRGHYHKRLSELKRQGLVREMLKKRECSVTGRLVYAWDVTANMPKEHRDVVRKPPAEDISDALADIKAVLDDEVSPGCESVLAWLEYLSGEDD